MTETEQEPGTDVPPDERPEPYAPGGPVEPPPDDPQAPPDESEPEPEQEGPAPPDADYEDRADEPDVAFDEPGADKSGEQPVDGEDS